MLTPEQQARQKRLEISLERRRLDEAYDLRRIGANEEFARWREENSDFTSGELIEAWKGIRRAWGLMPEQKPRKPRREKNAGVH